MFPQYSIHRCNIMINQHICDNSSIPYDIYNIYRAIYTNNTYDLYYRCELKLCDIYDLLYFRKKKKILTNFKHKLILLTCKYLVLVHEFISLKIVVIKF